MVHIEGNILLNIAHTSGDIYSQILLIFKVIYSLIWFTLKVIYCLILHILQVIYCYGDLVPRQSELFTETSNTNGRTTTRDLLGKPMKPIVEP